jgi:hypothetical protein
MSNEKIVEFLQRAVNMEMTAAINISCTPTPLTTGG